MSYQTIFTVAIWMACFFTMTHAASIDRDTHVMCVHSGACPK